MHLTKTLYFVIPDFDEFLSGGNIYNQELIQGLEQSEYSCQIITLDKLGELLNSDRPQFFFIDSLYLNKAANFLLETRGREKLYLIVHHLESLWPPREKRGKGFFEKEELPLLKLFNGFLTSSHFTAKYLQHQGELNQPIIIVPPALNNQAVVIPTKTMAPIRALLVANLVERKGILPFLEALKGQDWSFLEDPLSIILIGSEKMEPVYASTCLEVIRSFSNQLITVQWKGTLSGPALEDQYLSANLFISSSFMETFGMALQEARYYHLPILAVDGGNSKFHIKQGINGFLFSNPEELVTGLVQLCQDINSFQTLLNNAERISKSGEPNTWKDAVESFIQQLERIL